MRQVSSRHAGVRTLLFGTFALFAIGLMWNRPGAPPPRVQFTCKNSPDTHVCTDAEKATALEAACNAAGGITANPNAVCPITYVCGSHIMGANSSIDTRYTGDCSICGIVSPDMAEASPDMTMSSTGGGLTLTDGDNRFSTYTVPSVTCMNDASYGDIVAAAVPQSIVTALGLTESGTYTFMFYSGSYNNVLIVGPPPMGTIYYKANASGLTVATSGMSGALPSTPMTGASGATGTITAGGTYTCP